MGVKSAERVLEIFELLKDYPNGLTAKQIGDELGYAPSSAFGLVKTMEEKGYLMKIGNKQYALGARLIQLGKYASSYLDVNRIGGPMLKKLMEELQETVFMAVLSGSEIVYVEKVDSFRSVSTNARLGGRKPLYCTGLGKAFLAFLPKEESNALMDTIRFVPYTPNTILDKKVLKSQLDTFRKQGYAIDNEEIEVGLYCVSAPVYNEDGQMEAAISVSGPTARILPNKETVIARVLAAAGEISEKMGYDPAGAL